MRLFGLIGGLAPASTAEYYQTINTEVRMRLSDGYTCLPVQVIIICLTDSRAQVRRRLGGQHTATLLIWSCDQQEYIVRAGVLAFTLECNQP